MCIVFSKTVVKQLLIALSVIFFSSSSSYAAVNESPEFGFPEIMILLVFGCLIWRIWEWIKRFRKSSVDGVAESHQDSTPDQTNIFCGKCGESNSRDNKFCTQCGQTLAS